MSVQPLRVGVIGAGTVGREVVRAFLERSSRLLPPDGAPLLLVAVAEKLVRKSLRDEDHRRIVDDAIAKIGA